MSASVEGMGVGGILAALLGSSVLGGVLSEALRKLRSKEDKAALNAVASRDQAQGEAAVIASMASAFTGTTGALREEIDRMQDMLNDLRQRVVEAEAELRASAAREAIKDRQIEDLKAQLEISHADVIRLRSERDTAIERTVQQEGEIRQLNAIVESAKRMESKL